MLPRAAACLAGMVVCLALPAAGVVAQGTGDAARARSLQERAAQLQQERSQLDNSLRETARLIQQTEGRLTAIETRQKELMAQEAAVKASLAKRHGSIVVLLAAMQRMGRNPPPVMITRREDALKMVRSAMILARAFPELSQQALALAGRLTELARVRGEIDTEAEKLRIENAQLNAQSTRIAQLIETKRASLSEMQPQLAAARRDAERVAGRVNSLDQLITELAPGAAQQEQQQAAATPPPAAAMPVPSKALPATPQAPAAAPQPPRAPQAPTVVAELRPQTTVAALSPGALKPALPFSRTKGTLPMPAQGKRVLAFGDRTQYGALSKGIVVETRPGARVVSPSEGTVVFAGEFRTFGQLLIINAEDGYHILLAGLSQIDVQIGQFVLAGEPVGVMSAPLRASQDKTSANAPVLYVEFRKDNKPINPEPWWAASSRKVQG